MTSHDRTEVAPLCPAVIREFMLKWFLENSEMLYSSEYTVMLPWQGTSSKTKEAEGSIYLVIFLKQLN